MFTTGVPRYEHSLMPADELPTRHAVAFSSAMNSFDRQVGDEAHAGGVVGRRSRGNGGG